MSAPLMDVWKLVVLRRKERPGVTLRRKERPGVTLRRKERPGVTLRRRERPGHTDAAFVTYSEECCELSEAILERGVENWLDALVEEMAANSDQIAPCKPRNPSATID